ncbi:MAG: tetratricopeptide repeat protein [Candidatus Promineifilaceae bacterium]
MSLIQIDILDWIPETVRQQILDGCVDFLATRLHGVKEGKLSHTITQFRSDHTLQTAINNGLEQATNRFIQEYMATDEDLVLAIARDPAFWQSASVRQALVTLVENPTLYLEGQQTQVARGFVDVLHQRINRERVDQAVTFYLRCVAEALWHLEPFRPVYQMYLHRISAEQATAMVQELRGLRAELRETLLLAVRQSEATPQLASPAKPALPPPTFVRHNLPQRDYGQFVGRTAELAQVARILRPYPHSQYPIVTIDGVGGIGKSALALEIAHRYLQSFTQIPVEERFAAIIWVSAKQTMLTAEGIKRRRQPIETLDDIFATIAITLEQLDINQAQPPAQEQLVRQALTRQRTLLIVDNLETVDDEAVLTFLREIPAPTKVIVTTRHRLDVAYPVRLVGMPWEEASQLIAQEARKRAVQLQTNERQRLYDRTGGVPLAIVWSVAQMGYGYGIQAVLHRLGEPTSDLVRFCFENALMHIQGQPAHALLMALSLFTPDGGREALGVVADLLVLDRDEGLVRLEKLSLVNKNEDRFSFLPVTRVFAAAELEKDHVRYLHFGRRWVDYLKQQYIIPDYGADRYYRLFLGKHTSPADGPSLLAAIEWAYQHGTAEDIFVLTIAAADYLDVTGQWQALLELIDQSLSLAHSSDNPTAVGRLADIKGWQLEQRGEYAAAEASFREGLEHYREVGDEEAEAVFLQRLAGIQRKYGHFDAAADLIEEAWAIAARLSQADLKALIHTQRGKLERDRGNWTASWHYFSLVQDWFEQRTEQTPLDEELAVGTWGHLAFVAYQLGRPEEARELCLRSLSYFEGRGTKGYYAALLYRLALAEEALGNRASALQHATEALEWFIRLGMKPDVPAAEVLVTTLNSNS